MKKLSEVTFPVCYGDDYLAYSEDGVEDALLCDEEYRFFTLKPVYAEIHQSYFEDEVAPDDDVPEWLCEMIDEFNIRAKEKGPIAYEEGDEIDVSELRKKIKNEQSE